MDRMCHEGAALAAIGLSAGVEAVWKALLASPQIGLDELSALTQQSPAAVREALDLLFDRGFLRAGEGTPTGLVAVDPARAVEIELARAEREVAERMEQFAAIRSTLPHLATTYSKGRVDAGPIPSLEVIESLDEVRRQLYRLASGVVRETRSMEPGGLSAQRHLASMDHAEASQDESNRRGVRDCTLIAEEVVEDPRVYARFRDLLAAGSSVRTLPRVDSRMFIADRSVAVLSIDPWNSPRGALFIRVPAIVEALAFLFDQTWAYAHPLVLDAPDDDAPDGRPARTLQLVASGMTDARIARSLGVGTRTVRRDVADLKVALGAGSRTEIVAEAARRGWI